MGEEERHKIRSRLPFMVSSAANVRNDLALWPYRFILSSNVDRYLVICNGGIRGRGNGIEKERKSV